MTPERSKAVVNQRLELRATKTTTTDLGSWMVYMISLCFRALEQTVCSEAQGLESHCSAGQLEPTGHNQVKSEPTKTRHVRN